MGDPVMNDLVKVLWYGERVDKHSVINSPLWRTEKPRDKKLNYLFTKLTDTMLSQTTGVDRLSKTQMSVGERFIFYVCRRRGTTDSTKK